MVSNILHLLSTSKGPFRFWGQQICFQDEALRLPLSLSFLSISFSSWSFFFFLNLFSCINKYNLISLVRSFLDSLSKSCDFWWSFTCSSISIGCYRLLSKMFIGHFGSAKVALIVLLYKVERASLLSDLFQYPVVSSFMKTFTYMKNSRWWNPWKTLKIFDKWKLRRFLQHFQRL